MNNSMIARLLAKENITVSHGNFRTAFFDVENRVLGLPLWKDMGKDVYDLLVGHEVGHALETPADGWHESTAQIPGCPRAYINIVEDIRIEKLVQRQYPGLVSCFKRGYSVLNDEDFFGIEGKDVNTLHLADRINLKAKLRGLVDVQFSDKEKAVVDKAFAVETWEDVLDACRDLYNFIEDNKNDDTDDTSETDELVEASDDGDSLQGDGPSGENDGAPSDENSDSDDEESGSSDLDAQGELAREYSAIPEAGGSEVDPHISETDKAFRGKESSLLDTDSQGRQKQFVKAIDRGQMEQMLNSYEAISERRDAKNSICYVESFNQQLKSFNDDTKKFVGVMSKEFEMRKMAYRTKRAQTSRSGSLDMSRLHTYKYNDDIFSKVTQLADAKSHGMVMFIDFSGSMGSVIGDTIRQTLILAMFCKKVNIPFEVYSFTTSEKLNPATKNSGLTYRIHTGNAGINTLLTSTMKKNVFEKAYRELFMIASRGCYVRVWDSLGGTPLNETIMASRFILADFKARTQVQKVNVVFLTDGDAQTMAIEPPCTEMHEDIPTVGQTIMVDGKRLEFSRFGCQYKITTQLLSLLREQYNVIGYFLADSNHEVRRKLWEGANGYVAEETTKEYLKEYRKNKFVSLEDSLGYDKLFIIKADRGSLNTDDDEFEVSDNAKKSEIQRAFKKHANSKKTNKMFATQFAKMVA